ncbi:TraC family protein (plasmid) [Sinorhizobium meliloti]|nr:TraC family protein [Sinorhizobium meliloti]
MKKPSSKIRAEIAQLQEQLKAAETREAERIGRIALKAGLGEIEVDEAQLQAAFEDLGEAVSGRRGSHDRREEGSWRRRKQRIVCAKRGWAAAGGTAEA